MAPVAKLLFEEGCDTLMGIYPSGFRQYAAVSRSQRKSPDRNLARYAARYKFAGQIESVEMRAFTPHLVDSYTLVLRLSLAYSAYESLVAYCTPRQLPIKDEHIAATLKSATCRKLKEFLIDGSDKALRNELTAFFDSPGNKNLLPVIKALRHSMFHGQLTPTAAGLTAVPARKLLEDLERKFFEEMDSHSKKIFRDLIAQTRNHNE